MPGTSKNPTKVHENTTANEVKALKQQYLKSLLDDATAEKQYIAGLNDIRIRKMIGRLTADETVRQINSIRRDKNQTPLLTLNERAAAGRTYLPPPPDTMPREQFIEFLKTPFNDSWFSSEGSAPQTVVNAELDYTLTQIVASIPTDDEAASLRSSVESQSQPRTQASLPSFQSSVSEYHDTQAASALDIIRTNGLSYFTPSPSQYSVGSPSQSPDSMSLSSESEPPPLEQLEIEMIGKITNAICYTAERLLSAGFRVIPPTVSALITTLRALIITTKTVIEWKYTVAVLFLILRRYPILQPYMDMFALTIFKFIGRITGITGLINMAGDAAHTALQAAIENAITPALDVLKALPAELQAAIATMVSEFKDELKAIVVGGMQAGAERAVIDAALNAAQASFWTRFTQAAAGTAAQGAAQAAATTAIGLLMNGAQVALNARAPLIGLGGGKRKTKTSKKRKSKTNKKRKTKTRRR